MCIEGLIKTLLIFLLISSTLAHEQETIVIERPLDAEVVFLGRDVVIKSRVKGILVFGGNVIVEGSVYQDVATIGGSVLQKKGAYIGGDVIIFGGNYNYEDETPNRGTEGQTIIYAGYEEELRRMAKNPAEIFSISFSWDFAAQRVFSVLFWFLLSLFFTTVASEAVSKAVTNLILFPARTFWKGFWSFILLICLSLMSLAFLPGYFSAVIVLIFFLVFVLAYVFGRITIQILIGKWVQRRVSRGRSSDSIASLIGVIILTFVYSVPYVWGLAVIVVWVFSLGILANLGLDPLKEKNLKP